MLELKEQLDLGNRSATDWLYYARKRLLTETALKMAETLLKTNRTDWWFKKETALWVNNGDS